MRSDGGVEFGSRFFSPLFSRADDAADDAKRVFFFHSLDPHLDRVEALLLDVRLLGVGDDDQGAAARGDSAVAVSGRREGEGGERGNERFRFFCFVVLSSRGAASE